jgi:hypothetical protein
MTKVDPFSLCTVPLHLSFTDARHDQSLGHATASIWESRGKLYLITNWHVVTGRHFQTGENLREDGGRPNKIAGDFKLKGQALIKLDYQFARGTPTVSRLG